MKDVTKKILRDIKVELGDEFSQNFVRKSFFSEAWQRKSRRNPGAKGESMLVTGNLRNSIRAELRDSSVVFKSSLPYAGIMNDGGVIKVTARMKKFFWAKYYETGGRVKYKKNGSKSQSRASQSASAEAEFWKMMALKKIGSIIKIDARKYIGDHAEVRRIVKDIINENLKEKVEKDFKETAQKINSKHK